MTLLDALILGILQGITEFLPISSSGHLIVAESIMNLDMEMLKGFDIAVHFGTLLAIIIYFWRDYLKFIKFVFHPNVKEAKESGLLIRYLIIGTIPAIIVGLFFGDLLDELFRNTVSVAIMLILVGILFFVAEYILTKVKISKFNQKNTLLIGIAQACALIPGVSRAGATIAAGISQGIKREEAARFSFLLGSIAILAASSLSIYEVFAGEMFLPGWDVMLAGIISSFIVGYITIAFLIKFLVDHTLKGFGVYRIILGLALLVLM